MVLVPGPFRQIVKDISNPLVIENVACWFECIRQLGTTPKVKQCGKGQPHPAAFISNRGSALVAAHLTGQTTIIHASLAIEKP